MAFMAQSRDASVTYKTGSEFSAAIIFFKGHHSGTIRPAAQGPNPPASELESSERFYGRFERQITLDRDIDENAVNATFKNGVLTVTVPKSTSAVERSKRIQ